MGYTIDGILRIFRLEGGVSFQDGKYLDYGFRIGITSNFMGNFSDNLYAVAKQSNQVYCHWVRPDAIGFALAYSGSSSIDYDGAQPAGFVPSDGT